MTSFFWTLEQLADAVNGQIIPPAGRDSLTDWQSLRFACVTTDSRQIDKLQLEINDEFAAQSLSDAKPSVLYIAIVGERFNGHQFIDEVVAAGGQIVLVSELQTHCRAIQVLVEDTRIALGKFAHWHRLQMPVEAVVGITGSNGKTTTKTMMANLLQTQGATLMTQGNLNNDYGVPRTLLELRPYHRFAVIEMGANHIGEIDYLTRIVQPDIALLNNAGNAHLEGFGSLAGVIQGKGEIFQGILPVSKYAQAVINRDSPGYADWQATIASLGLKAPLSFGNCTSFERSNHALALKQGDVCWLAVEQNALGMNGFELRFLRDGDLQHLRIKMPLLGEHNAYNAAATAAIALYLGVTDEQIQRVFANFTGVSGRLQSKKLSFGYLIDDSYNANPSSVKAGIDVLSQMPGEAILCLGAMAELGEDAPKMHQELAVYAAEKKVKGLLFWHSKDVEDYALADCFLASHSEDSAAFAKSFSEHSALSQALQKYLSGADRPVNVLVKGSRSAQMEKVSKALIAAEMPTN